MAVVGVGLYVKGSMEAVRLYCEAFGMELGYHVLRQDGKGYYHSELSRNGEPALSVVEAEHTPGANPVQLGITFDSRTALEKAYGLLAEGGETEMEPQTLPWSPWAACLRDRFGVRWFLSLPQHMPGDDFVPEV
jgi:PhnB protein